MARNILIDMDDTLYDFLGGITALYREKYPDDPFINPEDMYDNHFSKVYREQLGEKAGKQMEELFHTKELYKNLKPLPNAVEAVNAMIDEGFDVRICSSIINDFRSCVLEKYELVEKDFGEHLRDYLILTRDKTAIKADILIDDNPRIKGKHKPEWKHILLDQPYNRKVDIQRIQSWKEWGKTIKI